MGNRTAPPYAVMSYIHWLSQGKQLGRRFSNQMHILLKSYKLLTWTAGMFFRWIDVCCLSLFASGTTKGKLMPLCEGKLGHEKATSFLVLRGRIYSLAIISPSRNGWKMFGTCSQIYRRLCKAAVQCAFFAPLKVPPEDCGSLQS